ncbi:MAG: hypothetical protein A2176_05185 [Spirochaetes bacterium RBG_13_51_14]|nr:MAG: hypothetical protein A2176_05185 [Spirochaetes bacterium RBG_13_51_14]
MIPISILLCLATAAVSAFDYRETPPAALFPFCQAAADASLPDAISNPAYLPSIRYPYLHCSGGMPYTLDELYSSTIRIGYGTHGVGIQAVWNRFGFAQYLEHIVEGNIGYMPVKYVSIGAGVYYYNLTMDTVEISLSSHLVDGRASILVSPCRWIDLSFLQENIGSLLCPNRRDLLFPEWSAGAALRPVQGFTLLYNMNRTAVGYVNSISASANVLKYFSVKVGYAREANTYSASLCVLYRYVAASYGLKYHPHLGFTHSVGITLSTQDINIESLGYGPLMSKIRKLHDGRKIDINTCSYDDLLGVRGCDRHYTERIMKYRKTIGPLTRTGLLQIGMSEKEVNHMLEYITGLAPEDPDSGIGRRGGSDLECKQKRLFRDLIELGLPAATALEIAELAVTGDYRTIQNRINSLPALDARKKKRAQELCTGAR